MPVLIKKAQGSCVYLINVSKKMNKFESIQF